MIVATYELIKDGVASDRSMWWGGYHDKMLLLSLYPKGSFDTGWGVGFYFTSSLSGCLGLLFIVPSMSDLLLEMEVVCPGNRSHDHRDL